MSFEKIAEQKIREALERGELDHLKGKGRPLDHTEYFAAPADVRLGHQLLKSNGFVPEEVELMRDIADLRLRLEDPSDPTKAREIRRELNDRILKLDLLRDLRRSPSRKRR